MTTTERGPIGLKGLQVGEFVYIGGGRNVEGMVTDFRYYRDNTGCLVASVEIQAEPDGGFFYCSGVRGGDVYAA